MGPELAQMISSLVDDNTAEAKDVTKFSQALEEHLADDPAGRGILASYELAVERLLMAERIRFYEHGKNKMRAELKNSAYCIRKPRDSRGVQ